MASMPPMGRERIASAVGAILGTRWTHHHGLRLPRDISGDELARALGDLGYRVTRQIGSHLRLTTAGTPTEIVSGWEVAMAVNPLAQWSRPLASGPRAPCAA